MINFSEQDIVNKFIDNLKNKNIDFKTEIPYEGTRVDLGYWNKKYLYGVEFKLKNFRKVLYQARRIQNLFNFVYICMPDNVLNKEKINICVENNIGLLAFNSRLNKFSTLNKPKQRKIKIDIIKVAINLNAKRGKHVKRRKNDN